MSARHNRCHDWLAATPQKRWSSSGSIHFRVPFVRGSRKGEGITDLAHHINMIQYPHSFPSFPFVNYLPIYTIGPEQIFQKNWKFKKFNTKKMWFILWIHPIDPSLHGAKFSKAKKLQAEIEALKQEPGSAMVTGWLWSFVGYMFLPCKKHPRNPKNMAHTCPYDVCNSFYFCVSDTKEYPINEVVYGFNISFGSDFSCDIYVHRKLADFSLKIV